MRCLVLLLIFFVSSCQHKNQTVQEEKKQTGHASHTQHYSKAKDGAPSGPIPSFFKKIIPIHEPYSRYGNPGSYKIEGQKYSILRSASGYKARGIASWYGTKFHKQRTSSGDMYDMYSMTAAHKTLPLPSYVRVKNLDNGREAVVRVNDRGPFRHDRIIDLSYAAAAKLGLLPKGTARVEIESLVPKGTKLAQYYIQAGSFTLQKSANTLRNKLIKMTSSPVIIEQYQQHYIVKVGPFVSKAMTTNLQKRFASNGIKGSFSRLQ